MKLSGVSKNLDFKEWRTFKNLYSHNGGIRLAINATKRKGTKDIRYTDNSYSAELILNDDVIQMVPLLRVDGNHRLSAGQKHEEFYDINTPFCIILFSEHQKPAQYEKVIFHNINSKSEPLSLEETLNVILNDKDLFPDPLLKTGAGFGPEYFVTRYLYEDIKLKPLINLLPFYTRAENKEPQIKSSCLSLCGFMLTSKHKKEIKPPPSNENIFKALIEINNLFSGYEKLKTTQNLGLISACVFLFIKHKNLTAVKAFLNWIIYNNLHELVEMKAESYIDIYTKVSEVRHKQVFVSMPFGKPEIEKHYNNIEIAVKEINKEYGQEIKIRPVRVDQFNEGYSYSITDKILELIEGSGYLIADITEPNSNVYHELGFLMGLDKVKGIPYNNFKLICRMPKETSGRKQNKSNKTAFNISNLSQLRFTELDELRDKIKETLITYYQLNNI